jgi:hypothetical protein
MTLINVDASRPSPMWAVIRYLVFVGRPVGLEQARASLSPPSLDPADSTMFDLAIGTLEMLGMVARTDDGRLMLDGATRSIDSEDLGAFTAVLRERALAPELNVGIGCEYSTVGARDLTLALSWFLSHDPAETAMNWDEAEQRQQEGLRPEVGPTFVNRTRWPWFVDWASAVGLAAPALLDSDRLTPDCTAAVRQAVRAAWKPGDTVNAVEALNVLRTTLPVLPGGAYSTAVGIVSPGDSVAGPALSFALLRGDDERWLRLQRDADARQFLSVHNPEQPTFPRAYSSIVISEVDRD